MSDAHQISMFRQRNVEHLFAASAFVYPQYTLKECGWLSASKLADENVRAFWQILNERLDANATEEDAAQIAIRAALEANIYREILSWQDDLSYTPMPQAYAHEISRREYLSTITKRAAELQNAVIHFDDRLAKQIIVDMYSETQHGASDLPTALDVAQEFERAMLVSNRSVDTFIPPMDAALGGLERQTLTGLAARPSMGKTALALQIARNSAAAGNKVTVFSLEMSSVSLWARAVCPIVGTTWRDVRAGRVNAERLAELKTESDALANELGDCLRVTDGLHTAETIWRSVADIRPDLVVIDHLRLLKDKNDNEVKRLGNITQALKDMAKSFNCAVLLCIQLSRNVESRNDKRPILSDLRDSGEIEENLDVCLMMYREDYYNPPAMLPSRSKTELWIRKFRDGPKDALIHLEFDMKAEWFELPSAQRL